MSTSVPQPMVSYDVTQITEETDISTPGQAIPAHRVRFRTAGGIDGSVLIPDARLGDLAYVAAEIAAQASKLQAVKDLGAGM